MENTEEKLPPEDFTGMTDEEILERAEQLIADGSLDEAGRALDCVKEKSGRKYFVQSKLFNAKGWFTEQRKQLKLAIKAEPDNEEYKEAFTELENFRKSDEYKSVKKQMGGKEGLAECCLLCSCECCAQGLCESICEGCG